MENQCDFFVTCGVYGVCSFNCIRPICEFPIDGEPNKLLESNNPWNGCLKLVPLGACKENVTIYILKRIVLYGLYLPVAET